MIQKIKAGKEAQKVKGKAYRTRRNWANKVIMENHKDEWQAAFDTCPDA
tara:strand:+ start:1871 stop:2017 length:147 start_codon:yes stop_codon:yes gene_type:complete